MDKKTLSTPIPPRDICKWHNLPTVTVYMFALYFSPTFNLPFGGETGDRPATRWSPCAPEINTGSKVSPGKRAATPSAKAANFPQRESTEEEGIHGRDFGVFREVFLGKIFWGRFVVWNSVGFYW